MLNVAVEIVIGVLGALGIVAKNAIRKHSGDDHRVAARSVYLLFATCCAFKEAGSGKIPGWILRSPYARWSNVLLLDDQGVRVDSFCFSSSPLRMLAQ